MQDNTSRLAPPVSDPLITGLLGGTAWAGSTITFAFPTSAAAYTNNDPDYPSLYLVNFQPFSAEWQAFTRRVLEEVESFTNLTFTQGAPETATLRWGRFDDPDNLAYAFLPIAFDEGGDQWFANNSNPNPINGEAVAHVIRHELGHALGLSHPQDGLAILPLEYDSIEYTVMSYRRHTTMLSGDFSGPYYEQEQSFMLLDIAALQHLYGANYSFNSGDTTYTFDPSTGQLFINGVGGELPPSSTIYRAIWDGGGSDTYDFRNFETSQIISLEPGGWSTVSTALLAVSLFRNENGGPGDPVYAAGNVANALLYNGDTRSLIENAVGGSGADVITGNSANNRLSGQGGGNRLIGLAGNDTLLGGDGYALSAGEGQVFRIYQATLGRAPDAPGLDFWSGQLAGGLGLSEIAAQFIGSAEFQARFGAQDNAGFVTLLYNNVLGRAPDPGGFQFWLNELNGGRSVSSMVLGFSESAEFIQGTEQSSAVFATLGINGAGEGQIFRVYQSTLGRAPDEGGFLFWTEQLAQGMSLADIVSGFTGSAEFQARFGAPDDAAFVRLLYTNVLGREPDAGGFEFYVGALGQGRARNSVVLEFSESVENQLQTTDDLATFMRTVATGLADTLEGGAGDDVLFGGRGADTFVFRAGDAGSDRVYGLDAFDTLQLIGFGLADRDAFLAGLTAAGEDVVFQNGDLTITFLDTNLETLQGVGLLFG